MRHRGQRPHQLAALAPGQGRIGGFSEHVTKQADPSSPFDPDGLLIVLLTQHRFLRTIAGSRSREGSQQPLCPRQSELVLQPADGQHGASNRPADAADAHHHGDTSPTRGHRDRAATTAPSTAATASANAVPVAAGGTGSTPTATCNTVNHTRSACARAANVRNHPRTVSTGRLNDAAVLRAPTPAAFALSAAPITSARSALRSNANRKKHSDLRHDEHRVRRGRTTTSPTDARNERTRAQPHGLNEPSQPGHANPPDTSRASTSTGFAPTVSTAPPCATRPSREVRPKRSPGGRSHAPHRQSAAPNERHTETGTRQDPSRTQCRIHAAPVSTLKDAGQSPVWCRPAGRSGPAPRPI
jgi:hypothetical protein